MKDFEVYVWEEIGARVTVKAKNKKEAEKKALQQATDYGLSFDAPQYKGLEIKITHRDTQIV